MNAGERDELLIKLYLVSMRDSGSLLNGVLIKSVGFGGLEYLPIPSNVPKDFYLLNNADLADLALLLESLKQVSLIKVMST